MNYSSANCICVHSLLRGGCQLDHCKQLIRAKVYCLFDGLWMSHPLSASVAVSRLYLFLILLTSCLCTVARSVVSIPTRVHRHNHWVLLELVYSVHSLMSALLTFRKVSCQSCRILSLWLLFMFTFILCEKSILITFIMLDWVDQWSWKRNITESYFQCATASH